MCGIIIKKKDLCLMYCLNRSMNIHDTYNLITRQKNFSSFSGILLYINVHFDEEIMKEHFFF